MKEHKPSPEEIRALLQRHNVTPLEAEKRLYGIKSKRFYDWMTGRRDCPAVVWWQLVLEFDGIDLRAVEE